MPNGSFGKEQARVFNSVNRWSGELDPLFDPPDFEFRCVSVPNSRKQCYDIACFDTITLVGHIRFKYTSAGDYINELISG
jgi:hypothetical protein